MNTIESATSISFWAKPNILSHPQQRLSSSIPSSLSTSTSISKQLLRKAQDQEGRIRFRLLHRLGIDPKQSMRRSIQPTPDAENRAIRAKIVSVPFLQPLKDSIRSPDKLPLTKLPLTFSSSFFAAPEASDSNINNNRNDHDTTSAERQKCCDIAAQCTFQGCSEERTTTDIAITTASTAPRMKRTVRFDNYVVVIPIPSRHAYSNRIKQALWSNRNEIRDIVKKNRYEFTVEGWDWNLVLEDKDMYVDIATGEKVHPCWVELRKEHENENESEYENANTQLERCGRFEHLLYLCTDTTFNYDIL